MNTRSRRCEGETRVINIRLPASEIEALDEQAAKEFRSRSGYIRKLISSALDAPSDKTLPHRSEATQ